MKKLKRSFFVLLAILTAAGLTYAQETEGSKDDAESQMMGDEKYVALAENLASDLQTRVDLREDQVEQVQNILVEYFAEVEPISGSSGSIGSNMGSDAVSDPSMSGAGVGNSGMTNTRPDNTGVGTDGSMTGNNTGSTNMTEMNSGMADTTDNMYGSDTTDTSGSDYGTDTSGSESDYGTDESDTSDATGDDVSSDQSNMGTGTGSYSDRVNVVGEPGNVSGSSSISTNGNKTSTMNDADALGDAFEARQRADNKIQEVLDEEQKKDYASEKADWWSDIQDKFESA